MNLKEFGWIIVIGVIAFLSAIPVIATILASIVIGLFILWSISKWFNAPKFNPWNILRKED